MARPPAGDGGGSLALAAFVDEHERALTFDFRHFFHVPLSEIGATVTYGEAIALINELMLEQRSHVVTSMRGWDWVASTADVAMITLAEWYTNAHRDRKEVPKPFQFPRPWPETDPNADVTAEERAELEQKLLSRSALRDR